MRQKGAVMRRQGGGNNCRRLLGGNVLHRGPPGITRGGLKKWGKKYYIASARAYGGERGGGVKTPYNQKVQVLSGGSFMKFKATRRGGADKSTKTRSKNSGIFRQSQGWEMVGKVGLATKEITGKRGRQQQRD